MANLVKRIGVSLFIAGLLALYAAPALTQFAGLIPTDTLLGRDSAGDGEVEPITVGGALSFTGSGGITATGANILGQLTAGTAIDFSSATIDWDSTEVGTTTWGSGSGIVWTFNAGATDPVLTFGSDSIAITGAATLTTGGNTIWHAGNDGAGSGLDADLLDGTSSAGFALSTVTLTAGVGLSGGGDLTANRTFTLDTTEVNSNTWGSGAFTTQTFDAGVTDPVWTYSSGVATLSTGDLRATTAGTDSTSVVTVGGTQTFTNKTFD